MKTLKKTVVVLDDGDQLEVGVGDIRVEAVMGHNDEGSYVRVSRPATDGRVLIAEWQSHNDLSGDPPIKNRVDLINGAIRLDPKTIIDQ